MYIAWIFVYLLFLFPEIKKNKPITTQTIKTTTQIKIT